MLHTANFEAAGRARHPENCPALVLNAEYTPLSYYPLSLWPWQTAIKAVFLDKVDIVSSYERHVHSPSVDMQIPSVIALRQYVKPSEYPAFTRFNLFLRDAFTCQYCTTETDLTFDHVIPRSKGGPSSWDNIVASCAPCNRRKGDRLPHQINMHPRVKPRTPNAHIFIQLASPTIPATWKQYLHAEAA
ncbi:MAG: HNH endonuclease [Pyrinomonadaceae bacterium]